MKYDILAVDLDGTLVGPDGHVSEVNKRAVEEARANGLEIVVCTGRGLRESAHLVDEIDGRSPAAGRTDAPMVTAGGALIVDAASGKTIHRWSMDPGLVREMCGYFAERNRAPLLFKDRDAAGFDYLVIDTGPIEEPSRWWFEVMDVEVKFAASVEQDPHPEHTVRLGFAATVDVMTQLAAGIVERFGERALIHHFAAVGAVKDGGKVGVKDDGIHLLEVFDPAVSKWTAIHRLALEQGVPRERIAAVGDEINDIRMIEGAALGIAMGNAVEGVRAVSDVTTKANGEDGVAHAIEMILSGEW